MKTTKETITPKMSALKSQVKGWNEARKEERKKELVFDVLATVREILEAVEADENFIEPEECRDTDRNDPMYQCAVATHAEELASTLDDSENALVLRVLASYVREIAHISGLTPELDLTELARAFNIE